MSDPVLKLKILVRSELALAQIRVQRAASRSVFSVAAMVFALLALGMLNFAGFLALQPSQGPAVSALIVSLTDAAVAVAVLLAARKAGPKESEERLAREIRDLAYAELVADVDQVKAELAQIASDVRSIRSNFISIGGTLRTVVSLAGMLVKRIKKNDD